MIRIMLLHPVSHIPFPVQLQPLTATTGLENLSDVFQPPVAGSSHSHPFDLASQVLQIDGAQLGLFVQIEEPPRPMDGLTMQIRQGCRHASRPISRYVCYLCCQRPLRAAT